MLRWILSCFLAVSVLLTSCANGNSVSASATPTASSQSPTAIAKVTE